MLSSWSIRKKLLLFLVIIFLPVFGIIVATGLNHRKDEIAKARENALLLAQSLATQQERITTATSTMLSTLAHAPSGPEIGREGLQRAFPRLASSVPVLFRHIGSDAGW